jgi:hypothetical protein
MTLALAMPCASNSMMSVMSYRSLNQAASFAGVS